MIRTACRKAGFSLVELSIVLVILGLLTGGILSGQSLIHAAELRAVTNDYSRYVAAARTFRDKYFAVPGDMTNAQSFWGTTSFNGDGNGQLNISVNSAATNETLAFWQHLTSSGLIEGSFPGAAGGSAFTATLGTNVPRSRITTDGWSAVYVGSVGTSGTNATNFGGGTASGVPTFYAGNYDNALIFGSASTSAATANAGLKPEDAWNIDTKLDDGVATTGSVTSPYTLNGSTGCANSGGTTPFYNLQVATLACALVIKTGF